jgi:putative transposase
LNKRRKIKSWTTDSNHDLRTFPNLIKNTVSIAPNQIWASDITYIRLLKGFCYLAAIIDIFTKQIRGWAIGLSLEAELAIKALDLALEKGTPEIHHSDQGVQYCSAEYVMRLESREIKISMSDTGEPTQNAFAESFFRTLKVEEVYLKEYETLDDAKRSIQRFIEIVYTKKRLHQSLGYLPPEKFEMKFLNERAGTKTAVAG